MFYKDRKWQQEGKPAFERRQAEEFQRKYSALSQSDRDIFDVFDGVEVSFTDKDGNHKGYRLKYNFSNNRLDVSRYGFGFFEDEAPYLRRLRQELAEHAKGTGVRVPWYI